MLMPKRVKYRTQHRGRMKGKAGRGMDIAFGDIGLPALEPSEQRRRSVGSFRKDHGRLTRMAKRLDGEQLLAESPETTQSQ